MTSWHKRLLAFTTSVVGLTALFMLVSSSTTLAQDKADSLRQFRAFDSAYQSAPTDDDIRVSANSDGDEERDAGSTLLKSRGLRLVLEEDVNQIPGITINEAADHSTFNEGDEIRFVGTANDFEDGDVTTNLAWVSSLDGVIGSGGSFSRTDLSVGVHTITATVMDSGGQSVSAITTITVFDDAPVLVGAGDIADDKQWDEATATLLDSIPGTVFTLGDNAYPNGTAAEFNNYYAPTWGRHKARTRPASGNHDYDTPNARAYYEYFGAAAGDPTKGYYSYDLGSWHIIVLNTQCSEVGGCRPNSPQGQWLQADLAANPSTCTLAIMHRPLFASGISSSHGQDFWSLLYQARADVILSGHAHSYERFAPQDPNGQADPNGIRQFIVGTGGSGLHGFLTNAANSEVRDNNTWGVLKLTLHPTSYDWEFIPIAGQTFTDSGSASCALFQSMLPIVIQ